MAQVSVYTMQQDNEMELNKMAGTNEGDEKYINYNLEAQSDETGRPRRRWEDDIEMEHRVGGGGRGVWRHMVILGDIL
jgi:hypothetical protein